jgi:hypothetical protein
MNTRYTNTVFAASLKCFSNTIFQLSPSNSRLETAGPVSTGPFITFFFAPFIFLHFFFIAT